MDRGRWPRLAICVACLLKLSLSAVTASTTAGSRCTVEAAASDSGGALLECRFQSTVESFFVDLYPKSPENNTTQVSVVSCRPCQVHERYRRFITVIFPEDTSSSSVWKFTVLPTLETYGDYECFSLFGDKRNGSSCSIAGEVLTSTNSQASCWWLVLLVLVPCVAGGAFLLLRYLLLRTVREAVTVSVPLQSTTTTATSRKIRGLSCPLAWPTCRRRDKTDNTREESDRKAPQRPEQAALLETSTGTSGLPASSDGIESGDDGHVDVRRADDCVGWDPVPGAGGEIKDCSDEVEETDTLPFYSSDTESSPGAPEEENNSSDVISPESYRDLAATYGEGRVAAGDNADTNTPFPCGQPENDEPMTPLIHRWSTVSQQYSEEFDSIDV